MLDLPTITGLDDIMCDLSTNYEITDEPVLLFDDAKVREWYEQYGNGMAYRDFKIAVHSYVLFHNWYNRYKNGFSVYNRATR